MYQIQIYVEAQMCSQSVFENYFTYMYGMNLKKLLHDLISFLILASISLSV